MSGLQIKAVRKCEVVPLLLLALLSKKRKKGKKKKKKKRQGLGWKGFSQDSFTLEPGAQELDIRGKGNRRNSQQSRACLQKSDSICSVGRW